MVKLKMILAMLIFGSLGVFISALPLPSSVIALSRAFIGTVFLAAVAILGRRRPDFAAIRRNAVPLLFSGAALGFNWIFLFEAYKYTTVAVATLCYYMAPVFVILLSPLLLKERLGAVRLVCSAAAVLGAVLISGGATSGSQDVRGILFALCAALLYCSIIITNKLTRGLSSTDTTLTQLGISALVMLAYTFFSGAFAALQLSGRSVMLLALVGILHTGVAYLLYFSAVGHMPAQTSAIFSYIDPVTAVLLSALVLSQPMTPVQICGAVLVLGAAVFNELFPTAEKSPAQHR